MLDENMDKVRRLLIKTLFDRSGEESMNKTRVKDMDGKHREILPKTRILSFEHSRKKILAMFSTKNRQLAASKQTRCPVSTVQGQKKKEPTKSQHH